MKTGSRITDTSGGATAKVLLFIMSRLLFFRAFRSMPRPWPQRTVG